MTKKKVGTINKFRRKYAANKVNVAIRKSAREVNKTTSKHWS